MWRHFDVMGIFFCIVEFGDKFWKLNMAQSGQVRSSWAAMREKTLYVFMYTERPVPNRPDGHRVRTWLALIHGRPGHLFFRPTMWTPHCFLLWSSHPLCFARARRNCAPLPILLSALTATPACGKLRGSRSPAPPVNARRGDVCRPQAPTRWPTVVPQQRSKWLQLVDPIATYTTPDLLFQHSYETLARYVWNSWNTCNIRLKHLQRTSKTLANT
jgi:hypothetical protein